MHYSQKYIQYSFPLVSSFQTFFYFRVFFKQIIMEKIQTYY